MSAPDRENTCALVVAFRPKAGLEDALRAILEQMPRLAVVENEAGRGETDLAELSGRLGFQHLGNESNLGQAAALNQGLAWAAGQKCAYVCLFDQDSKPKTEYFRSMGALWEVLPEPRGVLGCNYEAFLQGRRKLGFTEPPAKPYFQYPAAITAGSLLPLSLVLEIGTFREGLFVDQVDHDFCLRARAAGYGVFIASEPLRVHSIGDISYHRFLGKWLETSNHSAERRYYWYRNSTIVCLERLRQEPRWCLSFFCFHFFTNLINMLLFEKNKWRKLSHILRGVWDGLRRKEGPLSRPEGNQAI